MPMGILPAHHKEECGLWASVSFHAQDAMLLDGLKNPALKLQATCRRVPSGRVEAGPGVGLPTRAPFPPLAREPAMGG